MQLTTHIIRELKLTNVIGKGMFSVVTQHTGMSVLKHTACTAYNDMIYLPFEEEATEPRFVRGSYVSSLYVQGYMINTYELPLLKRFNIGDLKPSQKAIVHTWKKFIKQAMRLNSLDYFQRGKMLETLVESTFADYDENFLINLVNLVRSFDSHTRFDTKFKDSILLDHNDELVISDPVFSIKLLNSLGSTY